MSGKLWIIVRKEYLERVRSRSFVLGTLLGPILIAAMMFGPALLAERSGVQHMDVAVIDLGDGSTAAQLQAQVAQAAAASGGQFPLRLSIEETQGDLAATREHLDALVGEDELDGYVVLDPDFLRSGHATYYGERLSGVVGVEILEKMLDQLVQSVRMRDLGIDASQLAEVLKGADLELRSVGAEEASLKTRMMLGLAMIMLLYMMMIIYGQYTMLAVIEDKASRVVEVMLASVTTTELMLGKIFGQGLVGFTQFGVWVGAGLVFSRYGGQLLPIEFELGQVGLDLWLWFGVFFVLGYLLYSALYAGVGALCSSTQDAQQYQGPITMLIVLPMLLLQVAIQNPDSGLSLGLSLFPLFTPLLMFIRIVMGKPETWQIALGIGLLAGTVFLLLRMTGKLFRLSILEFGRAPNLKEVVQLLRSPD